MVSSISNYGLQALPPDAQLAREKTAILQDERLQKILDSVSTKATAIDFIAWEPKGADKQFIVRTDTDYIVRVNLQYTYEEMRLQPKTFELSFFDAEIPQKYATGRLPSF